MKRSRTGKLNECAGHSIVKEMKNPSFASVVLGLAAWAAAQTTTSAVSSSAASSTVASGGGGSSSAAAAGTSSAAATTASHSSDAAMLRPLNVLVWWPHIVGAGLLGIVVIWSL